MTGPFLHQSWGGWRAVGHCPETGDVDVMTWDEAKNASMDDWHRAKVQQMHGAERWRSEVERRFVRQQAEEFRKIRARA